jgi:phenylpyruvate tautomerase
MPLLKLQTSAPVTDAQREELLGVLSKLVAEQTHKPEKYVMVSWEPASILMSGKAGPAAFVDLRGIGGLSGEVNAQLSGRICALLNKSLGIPQDRIYLNFTEMAAANWGWNGATFG